ncbi:MAG: Hsp70 family protein [Actinomycetota bacterium]
MAQAGYSVGIDLGTTYSAAAIARDDRVEMFSLEHAGVATPSVVWVGADGNVLIGAGAARKTAVEPERGARLFKRRFGDDVPMYLGGVPYAPEELTRLLLADIVERVERQEGARPDKAVLTHPAAWGGFRLELLESAARATNLSDITLLPEPVAAAIDYAGRERIEADALVAVYDLGGGTFDTAVLRADDEGFTVLGTPDGVEGFGGADLDDAVFRLVAQGMGGFGDLDPDDPVVARSVVELRTNCREAKEALSNETSTSVLAMLPGRDPQEVRLTRTELEDLVRPRLTETVAALERTVASAGLEVDDLDRILLVGGASRMPLVGEIVADGIRAPLAIDTHPKHAIAQGAALVAARLAAPPAPTPAPEPRAPAPAPTPPVAPDPPAPSPELDDLLPEVPTAPLPDPPPRPAPAPPPPPEPARSAGLARVAVPFVLLAALVVAVAVVANNRFGGADDDPGASTTDVAVTVASGDETMATVAETAAPDVAADYVLAARRGWTSNQSLSLFLADAPPLAGNLGRTSLQAFECEPILAGLENTWLSGASRIDGAIASLPTHAEFDGVASLPDLRTSYETFRTEVLDFWETCASSDEAPDVTGHPWFESFVALQADLCVLDTIGSINVGDETFDCSTDLDRNALVADLDAAFRPE